MSMPSQARRRIIFRIGLVVVAIAFALIWQHLQTPPAALLTEGKPETALAIEEPIQPIPSELITDQAKFQLGEKLFKETRLSKNDEISCASCHKLERGGVDGKRYSTGLNGAKTKVNTPTVFNVAYNFRFNWAGQHESLSAHTDKLVQNPAVMGSEWSDIRQRLEAMDEYRQAFESIYTGGISKDSVIDAIVTYETALITPDAPFDQYLRGNQVALSAAEKEGYSLFKAYGCISCHQGTNVGGNMFQKFGVVGDYFADRGDIQKADLGRFNVTNDEADRYVFRVPSLRNVAMTSPYLHDGTAETLPEAIKIMVKYQLGRPIPDQHIDLMAQFLKTLTGKYKGVPLHDMTNVTGDE
ncbi:MAG: cytochrome c peroxidase [Phormidesmis sp.]